MNVMKRAWEIAREGQVKFGGKVSEYLSEALKMAWAEMDQKEVTIATSEGSRKHKSWVAEIVDTCVKYGFERKFVAEEPTQYREKVFVLKNGKVYEVCDGGNRSFVKVENNEIVEIEIEEVKVMFVEERTITEEENQEMLKSVQAFEGTSVDKKKLVEIIYPWIEKQTATTLKEYNSIMGQLKNLVA